MKIMGLAPVSDITPPRETVPVRAISATLNALEAAWMAVFAAIGWLGGVLWAIVATAWMAMEYGFRSGAGWPQREPDGDEPEPED
jgi:hypothetical protein